MKIVLQQRLVLDGENGIVLKRFKIAICRGWTISLHRVCGSGQVSVWHTHGWDSISICVWGIAEEETEDRKYLLLPGRIRFRPHDLKHRVKGSFWSAFLNGPRRSPRFKFFHGPSGTKDAY